MKMPWITEQRPPRAVTLRRREGFTLIEMLVSLTILASAMAIVALSFTNIIQAKTFGQKQLNSLHHGDFCMEQIEAALKSAAYFTHTPEKFAFTLDDDEDKYPADIISFVTYSTAFMPEVNADGEDIRHLKYGLHRIELSIQENDDDDEPALAVRAVQHMIDTDDEDFDIDEIEPWIVSKKVKGLNVRVYDEFEDEWKDEWEYEKALPHFVEVTIYLDPPENKRGADHMEMKRLIEIPVGIYARQQKKYWQEDQSEAQLNQQEAQQAQLGQQPGINPSQPGIGGVGNVNNRNSIGAAGFGNTGAYPGGGNNLTAEQQRRYQQQLYQQGFGAPGGIRRDRDSQNNRNNANNRNRNTRSSQSRFGGSQFNATRNNNSLRNPARGTSTRSGSFGFGGSGRR